MKKYARTLITAFIGLGIFIALFALIMRFARTDEQPCELGEAALEDSPQISVFTEDEKQNILDEFAASQPDFEVIDSMFGNKTTLIQAAIICRDTSIGSETKVAIISGDSVGVIDLDSSSCDYKYYSEYGITMDTPSSISLSLIKDNEIYDYIIEMVESNGNINYSINCKSHEDSRSEG